MSKQKFLPVLPCRLYPVVLRDDEGVTLVYVNKVDNQTVYFLVNGDINRERRLEEPLFDNALRRGVQLERARLTAEAELGTLSDTPALVGLIALEAGTNILPVVSLYDLPGGSPNREKDW